ncbi:CD1375 family protein [Enterococcus asini]|nr:CD1375 family protein [Enterococcus asini]MDT2756982.1 CD1375 family protein [Enterococcus asini]
MYSNLEMLYATHVIEGKRTIDSVPASIRENVAEIVEASKKQEETTE